MTVAELADETSRSLALSCGFYERRGRDVYKHSDAHGGVFHSRMEGNTDTILGLGYHNNQYTGDLKQ